MLLPSREFPIQKGEIRQNTNNDGTRWAPMKEGIGLWPKEGVLGAMWSDRNHVRRGWHWEKLRRTCRISKGRMDPVGGRGLLKEKEEAPEGNSREGFEVC